MSRYQGDSSGEKVMDKTTREINEGIKKCSWANL